MPKINQEEYEVLKDRIAEEIYSWDGAESGWGDDAVENVLEILDDFFWSKSVKYESEETEMKKDKEWMLERIENYIPLHDKTVGDVIERILEIAKQLDEPEVLSQEITGENGMSESEWAKVIDRYKWHLEQEGYVVIEKPTIPEFAIGFLDGKEEYALYELLDNDFIYDDYDELARWLYNNDEDTNKEREFSLVLAQRYGYELEEEEQKYYLKIGNLYLAEPLGDMTSDIVRMTRDKEVAYQFTDEKSIATHLDKFEGIEAVKVEELEEDGKN